MMERKKDVMILFSDEEGLRNKRVQNNEHITKPDGLLNYHNIITIIL